MMGFNRGIGFVYFLGGVALGCASTRQQAEPPTTAVSEERHPQQEPALQNDLEASMEFNAEDDDTQGEREEYIPPPTPAYSTSAATKKDAKLKGAGEK